MASMRYRFLFAATMLSGLAGASIAAAQTQAATTAATTASPVIQLQDVVVTARRKSENLQRTPVSVSALTAQAIEQVNLFTADKLSQLAPNISIAPGSGGIGGNTAFIRGIGSGEPLLTVDSPVGMYLDGVYLGRQAGNNFDLVDLDRVEVLRGPQGTLFGRNTTGGAVSLVTKTPSETPSLEEKVSYGSYNDVTSRTVVNTGEIGATGLTGTFSYLYHRRDGYVTDPNNPSDKSPGALDSDSAWGKLHGHWGALTADFTGDYSYTTGQREPFQIVYAYPGAQAYFAQSPAYGGQTFITSPSPQSTLPYQYVGAQHNQTGGGAATLQYEFSPAITLKSITAYRLWNAVEPTNYTDDLKGPVVDFTSPTLYSVQSVAPFIAYVDNDETHQFSQEVQILGKAGNFSYVGGVYYFEEHVKEYNTNNFTLAVPTSGPYNLTSLGYPSIVDAALSAEGLPLVGVNASQILAYSSISQSMAAFGQLSYRPPVLDDKLELTGGLRYTADHKSIDQTSVPVGFVPGPSRNADASFNNLSFLVSANYQWTSNVMSYARVASGYKSGGFDARAGVNLATGTTFPFTFHPETEMSYEVGLKTEAFDRRLRVNGDVFYSKYDNLQVSTYAGGNGFTPNADAHYTGFELEAQAIPIDHLTVQASIGYVDPVYDKFLLVNPATGIVGDYSKVAQFGYVPRLTTHLGGAYEFPPASFGQFVLRADYAYTSQRYFAATTLLNPANDAMKDPGQNLLSAQLVLTKVKIQGADVEFALFGDNLLNDERRDSGIDFGPSIGIAGVSRGEPISFGVSAKMKY